MLCRMSQSPSKTATQRNSDTFPVSLYPSPKNDIIVQSKKDTAPLYHGNPIDTAPYKIYKQEGREQVLLNNLLYGSNKMEGRKKK